MTNTPSRVRAVPRRVIATGVALGLAMLTALLVFFSSGNAADKAEIPAESTPAADAALETEISIEDKPEDDGRLKAVETQLADQQHRMEGIVHDLNRLTELTERLWALLDQNDLSERLDQIQRLAEVVADMRLDMGEQRAVPNRLDDLQTQIMGLQRTMREFEARRARDQNPPFSVVALDVWDGTAQAVVLANGATVTLEAGQSLEEWSLVEVDPEARTTRWRAPGGQDVALRIRR